MNEGTARLNVFLDTTLPFGRFVSPKMTLRGNRNKAIGNYCGGDKPTISGALVDRRRRWTT